MHRIKCNVPTAKTCVLGPQFPVGWEYMPGWSGHLNAWLIGIGTARAPHIAATGRELAGRGRRRLAGCLASRGGGGNPTETIWLAAPLVSDVVMILPIDRFVSAAEVQLLLGGRTEELTLMWEQKRKLWSYSKQPPSFMHQLNNVCTSYPPRGWDFVSRWNEMVLTLSYTARFP